MIVPYHCIVSLYRIEHSILEFVFHNNLHRRQTFGGVLRRAQQRIFVIRDTFSSYTVTKLLSDEQASTIKAALFETTAELKPPSGCTVRVDGALSFQNLLQDIDLRFLGIAIDLGPLMKCKKSPVAERAIQELERELKRAHPDGNPISQSQLALAMATLNLRLCIGGPSAREIVQQCDPHTGDQLNISDNLLGAAQHAKLLANHPAVLQAKHHQV